MVVLFVLVATLSLLSHDVHCSSQKPTTKWPSRMDESLARLGIRLLREGSKGTRSAVVSPLSVTLALAMVSEGAHGNTQKQFNSLMAQGKSHGDLNEYCKQFLKQLSKPAKGFNVNTDTKLFVQRDAEIRENYMKAVRKYAGHIGKTNFHNAGIASEDINGWARKMLDNGSEDMVEPSMFSDSTQMVLVNSASFDAQWQNPFNKFTARNHTFYRTKDKRKKISAIAQTNYFPYYSDKTVSAVALPYKGGKASMYIFLPTHAYGLSEFEKTFTAKQMFRIVRKMKTTFLDVLIPRFRMDQRIELRNALRSAGVEDAFSTAANFSRICPTPLVLSNLIHRAVAVVSEQGARLAERGNADFDWNFIRVSDTRPVPFTADHPFLFAVINDGKLIFIGRFRGLFTPDADFF